MMFSCAVIQLLTYRVIYPRFKLILDPRPMICGIDEEHLVPADLPNFLV